MYNILQRSAVQEFDRLPPEDGAQRRLLGAVQGLPAVLDAHGSLVAHILANIRTNTQQMRHFSFLELLLFLIVYFFARNMMHKQFSV
jgi:hypothetical protein